MSDAVSLYRLLGDDLRMRLLRVLAAERLNVTELTAILGIAQSGVSRHLGLLGDAGLVSEAREGGYSYYRVADALRDGRDGFGPLWALLQTQFAAAAGTDAAHQDDARLEEVRRLRRENFDVHAADLRERQFVPGRSWAAWARALGHLLPRLRVADLGCGEGYLTIEASRWASRVFAIDRSTAVLSRARALAGRRNVGNVVWKKGELDALPLRAGCVDVALLSQALHHATDPAAALAEAARVLVPGGRVLILDLREHQETWVRQRLGDRWLGFSDAQLAAMLKAAGFEEVRVTVGSRRQGDSFTVIIASATRPSGAGNAKKPRRTGQIHAARRAGALSA